MTFSIPQPIPARSSHPVQANQRPSIRRSQSHTVASDSPVVNSSRFSFSQLLAKEAHPLRKSNVGDDLALNNDDDDCQVQEDEEDEDEEELYDEANSEEAPNDSGHYSSDLDLESRGIPISKRGFHFNSSSNSSLTNKDRGHLYSTGASSLSSSSRLGQDLQDVSHYRYSHSHNSNSDGHNSINLIADNGKKTLAAASTAQHSPPSSPLDTASCSPTQDTQLTSRFQCHPQDPQQLQQDVPSGRSDDSLSLPRSQSRSPSALTVASTSSLPSPSPSPVSSTAAPQRAHRRDDAHVSQQTSFQSGFGGSNHTSSHVDPSDALLETPTADKNAANTKTSHHHSHHHPNISIDTSKACLQKDDPRAIPKAAVESQPSVNEATRPQRATTISTFPKARPEGQLSFGLKQDSNKAFMPTPPTSSSSTFPSSTAPSLASTSVGPVSNSSTRPLMMASQSRLSSALPPAPIPFLHHASAPNIHQQQQEFQSSTQLPSLSPSSPRANPALVNSLEQLSVSWKAPEQTPSFPINRLNRSRTISSGVRPNFTSSFSSNGSSNSTVTNSTNPFPNNNIMSPTMVTSSSYSSLPYSPAVAFLSNFVDVTAPRMAPDEEGEQVGDFIMGKVIGHGGFSVVREAFAVHMDGLVARVAVKIVKTQTGLTDNDRVQRMLDKEIAIWSRLSHPNVLPFLAVEKLPTDTFVFCELCSGGHLLDYLMRQEAAPPASASSMKSFSSYTSTRATVGLDESQARLIFNQVAEAVRYLHEEKRIVHRDIKLENILQHEDGTWKICDFGLAEYQNDEAASYFGAPLSPTIYNPRNNNNSNGNSNGNGRASSPSNSSLTDPDGCSDAGIEEEEDDMVGGSLAYCSPEQLRSQKPLRCPSSDVWSLGVVLYALLTGRLPFQDEYEPRLQFQILNGRYEDPTECSAEARDLLKNMFRSKPEDRWRIGQVIDSPWCMGTTLESSKSSSSNMFSGFGGFSMNTNTSNSNGNSGNGGGFGGGFGYRNDDDNGGYNCNTGGDHARMNNFFASFKF